MKYIIFFIVIVFTFSNLRKIDNDKLLWISEQKLTWKDFEMEKSIEEAGNKEAETQCEIKILEIKLVNNLPKILIGTFFVKSKSWTITNSSKTLSHEQLHFDIYELYSRKIRKKFDELNNKKESDIQVYQDVYSELINLAIKENVMYDNEVYFNDVKQQEWIDRVTKELLSLKDYEYIPDE